MNKLKHINYSVFKKRFLKLEKNQYQSSETYLIDLKEIVSISNSCRIDGRNIYYNIYFSTNSTCTTIEIIRDSAWEEDQQVMKSAADNLFDEIFEIWSTIKDSTNQSIQSPKDDNNQSANVKIDKTLHEKIKSLAETDGISFGNVLYRAIKTEELLRKEEKAGNKILIDGGKELKIITRKIKN